MDNSMPFSNYCYDGEMTSAATEWDYNMTDLDCEMLADKIVFGSQNPLYPDHRDLCPEISGTSPAPLIDSGYNSAQTLVSDTFEEVNDNFDLPIDFFLQQPRQAPPPLFRPYPTAPPRVVPLKVRANRIWEIRPKPLGATDVEFHRSFTLHLSGMPHPSGLLRFNDADYLARSRSIVLGRGDPKEDFKNPSDTQGKRKRPGDEPYQQSCGPYAGGILGPLGHDSSSTLPRQPTIDEKRPGPNGEVMLRVYSALDAHGRPVAGQVMSKEHVRFEYDDHYNEWTLEVLGRNGIWVGSEQAGPEQHIGPGEKILIEDVISVDMGRVRFLWEPYSDTEPVSVGYDSSSSDGFASDSNSSRRGATANSLSAASSRPQSSSASPGAQANPTQFATNAPVRRPVGRPAVHPSGMSKAKLASKKRHDAAGTIFGVDEDPPKRKINRKPKEVKATGDQDANATNEAADGKARGRSKKTRAQADAEDADAATADEPATSKSKPRERSPSPVYNKADYADCPEKLLRPQGTYAELIDFILRPLAPGGLCLQDIYKTFKKNWPYFAFNTTDWQSSIRHNVQPGNNPVIISKGKDESGKGQIWSVDIDKTLQTKQAKKAADKTRTNPTRPNNAPMSGSISHSNLPGMGYNVNAPAFPHAAPHMHGAHPPGQFNGPSIHGGPASGQLNGPPTQGGPYAAGPSGAMTYNQHQAQTAHQAGPSQQASSSGTASAMPIRGTQSQYQPSQRGGFAGRGRATSQQTGTHGAATTAQQARPMQNNHSTAPRTTQAQGHPAGSSNGANTTMTEQHIRALKRQTFENFRKSLVALAVDEPTKNRYQNLMNSAINYACTHADGVAYDGDNEDVKRIVEMLWSSWKAAVLNPNNAPKKANPAPAAPASGAQTQASNAAPAQVSTTTATQATASAQPVAPASSSSQAPAAVVPSAQASESAQAHAPEAQADAPVTVAERKEIKAETEAKDQEDKA